MYSLWGPWEPVSPLPRLSGEPVFLPGFLGVHKACQSRASLFPGKGAIAEACLGRGASGPSRTSGGVSDLQHLGMRLGSSELSFLLGALGYLFSSEGPASGAITPLVGAASWCWEGLRRP